MEGNSLAVKISSKQGSIINKGTRPYKLSTKVFLDMPKKKVD